MNNLIKRIKTREFLDLSHTNPVIDVRSPGEFEQGHIPGAVNIPLFNNDERTEIGTLYKRKGREEAILKGFEKAGPKMKYFLKEGIKHAGKNSKMLVHCWRGGMRSENMAWLFSKVDIECFVLEGGYKSYRNHINTFLSEPRKLIILGGLTGSGKTDILMHLKESGEQVIDLEELANHRGSAFGALGKSGQPTSEYFSNILYNEMIKTDPGKRLFLEDESMNIGSVFLPESIFKMIRESKVIALIQDVKTRIPRLLEDYGAFSKDQLKESVRKIEKRLGGARAMEAIVAIDEDRLGEAIEIVLSYYDKTYRYGLEQREKKNIHLLETDTSDPYINSQLVLKIVNRLKI